MEFLGFVVLVLGVIGASVARRHLREAKQLRLRQIVHEERLKAMEHNVPLPEVDAAVLGGMFDETALPDAGSRRGGVALAILWVRVLALCLGLASFFGGLGAAVGMRAIKDPEFSNYWAAGLIPASIGLGLLIFYVMSRSLGRMATERT